MITSAFIAALAAQLVAGQPSVAARPAPQFSLLDTNGRTFSAAAKPSVPTLLVLLNSRCPHNAGAVPEINELRRQAGSRARVAAIVDLSRPDAVKYASSLKLKAPLLADPTKRVIIGLGGTHSLDLVLLSKDGKSILGTWRGLSRKYLGEVQSTLRKAGAPNLRLNLARFSEQRQSGCGF